MQVVLNIIYLLFLITCTLPCPDCRPRSGFSPSGQEAVAPAGDNFRESFTFTALVSLSSDQPLWVSEPRDATNDAFDFLRVITWLLEEGALQAGDYPILDNARVHHATQTTPMIEDLLGLHGVQMRFLPAYSPELNPCEFVFAEVKRRLREQSRIMPEFWQETLRHFASITTEEMDLYYKHCIITPL